MFKKLLITLGIVLSTCMTMKSFAIANPGVDSARVVPSPVVYPGGTAAFQFDFVNAGTATSSTFVKFRISLQFLRFTNDLFNPATDIARLSGTADFTWQYLPNTNELVATLSGTLDANSRSRFQIKNLNVTQASPITNPAIGGNININTPANLNSSTANDNTNHRTYSVPPDPLPISLASFSALCGTGQTIIKWTTASELNNERFTVSRSTDLHGWSTVATISGAGHSNQALDYQVVDERPHQGPAYYRLTQYDYDGASETFAPISITCLGAEISNSMVVFPNPATEQFTVSVSTSLDIENTQTEIEIFNMEGKKVGDKKINLSKGVTQTTFDRNGLAPGQYIVRASSPYLVLKPIIILLQ